MKGISDFMLGLFLILFAIVPFFNHIYYCFTKHEYLLLLIGVIIAPIGWIHGLGNIFGWW